MFQNRRKCKYDFSNIPKITYQTHVMDQKQQIEHLVQFQAEQMHPVQH